MRSFREKVVDGGLVKGQGVDLRPCVTASGVVETPLRRYTPSSRPWLRGVF
jgi:hypothetical protein